MRKLFIVLLVAGVMLAGVVPMMAQEEGPSGTWYGTWPYSLPPEHNFNAFATGGLGTNLGTVYRPFVELTPAYYVWAEDVYRPLLAESWGFTEDGSAYEFTIAEGAMWSNGEPVTSADVVATYQIGEILGWSQFNYLDSVEAVDERTTRFNFSEEPSLLAERLILKDFISPASVYGDLAARAEEILGNADLTDESDEWNALKTEIQEFRPEELVVSGPYTYELSDVGDAFMTLSWQPNSLFSDTVQFGELRLWAGETEQTTPLVLSGDLAHSTNVYPASTQQAFEASGIRLVTLPRGYGPSVLFNHDVYPFNVKEVRQAAAHVIERNENAFLTNGFGATGTVYMAGLADESVPVFLSEETIAQLNRYEYNEERAAELLESVGFTRRDSDGKWVDADGNTIQGEYKFPAEFADFSGAAQNATDQLNAFGFDITARATPWQQTAEDIRSGDFDLSVWSWSSPSPYAARAIASNAG